MGSWIQGNYRPGQNDHDMRLILKDSANMSADDMAASWGEAQRKLAELGRKALGDKAPDLLKRTNIYAPEKLMQGVENAAAGDGGFGDTAAYRQNYDSKAGKVFYGDGKGKAFVGEVDLVHMAEGYGKYSPSVLGGISSTWSRLAAEAMEKGDAKSTAKYLMRIRDALKKARDLMRIGVDADMDRELRTLSGDFTAIMREGRKPGEQWSIYLKSMDQGTEYIYTWTPWSEATVEKITPEEKAIK